MPTPREMPTRTRRGIGCKGSYESEVNRVFIPSSRNPNLNSKYPQSSEDLLPSASIVLRTTAPSSQTPVATRSFPLLSRTTFSPKKTLNPLPSAPIPRTASSEVPLGMLLGRFPPCSRSNSLPRAPPAAAGLPAAQLSLLPVLRRRRLPPPCELAAALQRHEIF